LLSAFHERIEGTFGRGEEIPDRVEPVFPAAHGASQAASVGNAGELRPDQGREEVYP
jgi:hypothetical protein